MFAVVFSTAGIVAGALVVPWLMDIPGKSASEPGRFRWQDGVVLFLFLLAPASRCLGLEWWITSAVVRNVIGGTLGVGVAIGYCLFFTQVPRERRGVLFGLAAGIGPVGPLLLTFLTRGAGPERALEVSYTVVLVVSFVMAVAQVAAYVLFRRCPPLEEDPAGKPSTHSGRERRILLACLVGSSILFSMLNGFQGGRYYPNLNMETRHLFPWLSLWVIVLSPVLGYLMDRDLERWFRRLVCPCALIFMLVPALPFLSDSMPGLYRFIHHLATLASFIVMIGVTIAIDRVAVEKRFWCLYRVAPHITRMLMFMLIFQTLGNPLPNAVIMLLSTLAAVAFYEMIGFQTRRRGARGSAPDPAPADNNIKELFTKFGLTNRESEVAALLLQGLSTAEMADKLFISKVTVNFSRQKYPGEIQRRIPPRLPGGDAGRDIPGCGAETGSPAPQGWPEHRLITVVATV